MQVAPATPVAPATAPALPDGPDAPGTPGDGALVRQFMELRSRLEEFDGIFTRAERRGNVYPHHTNDDSMMAIARTMDAARMSLFEARPEARELVSRLGDDTRWVARTSGKLQLMSEQQITFGSGWSRTLDGPIATAIAAIDLLLPPAAASA